MELAVESRHPSRLLPVERLGVEVDGRGGVADGRQRRRRRLNFGGSPELLIFLYWAPMAHTCTDRSNTPDSSFHAAMIATRFFASLSVPLEPCGCSRRTINAATRSNHPIINGCERFRLDLFGLILQIRRSWLYVASTVLHWESVGMGGPESPCRLAA